MIEKIRLSLTPYDRADYIRGLQSINPKTGAEIGVYNGEFSSIFMKGLPDTKIYLIDPWRHLPDEEYNDPANDNDEIQQARYELVKAIVKKYGNGIIIRKKSEEALADFLDNSLDFVYIDANHKLENVCFDIENWSKKVRKGGFISGHDFSLLKPAVTSAVYTYCIKNNIENLTVLQTDSIWLFQKETE